MQNTNNIIRECNIFEGPSRDVLFDAFKYSRDEEIHIPVRFRLDNCQTEVDGHALIVSVTLEDVLIYKLEFEDGSGNRFNFAGVCNVITSVGPAEPLRREYTAYYDARTHQGYIEFAE